MPLDWFWFIPRSFSIFIGFAGVQVWLGWLDWTIGHIVVIFWTRLGSFGSASCIEFKWLIFPTLVFTTILWFESSLGRYLLYSELRYWNISTDKVFYWVQCYQFRKGLYFSTRSHLVFCYSCYKTLKALLFSSSQTIHQGPTLLWSIQRTTETNRSSYYVEVIWVKNQPW